MDVAGWDAYSALCSEWGARIDLTAPTEGLALRELLFKDAEQILGTGVVEPGMRLVDVGAGVGAPTIPLLLAVPDLRATLIEPRRKRVTFLRYAIGSLGLAERATVIEEAIDIDAPAVQGAPFDVSLSRATFEPTTWLRVGLALASTVLVFGAKGPAPRNENAELQEQTRYTIASTGAPRKLWVYRLTKSCRLPLL